MFTNNRNEIDLDGIWKFNPDPYQRCRQQKWWEKEGDNSSFFPCFNMEGMWDTNVPSTWKCEFKELKWYDGHGETWGQAPSFNCEAMMKFNETVVGNLVGLFGSTPTI